MATSLGGGAIKSMWVGLRCKLSDGTVPDCAIDLERGKAFLNNFGHVFNHQAISSLQIGIAHAGTYIFRGLASKSILAWNGLHAYRKPRL